MTDDIVVRLDTLASNYKTTEFEFMYADYETVCEASFQIQHLKDVIYQMIDELRFNGGFEAYTSAMVFQEFSDQAKRNNPNHVI